MRLLSRTHRLKMAHGRSCSVTAGIIPPVDAKTWVVGARLRSGTSVTIAEPGCHSASSVPSRMTWAHPPLSLQWHANGMHPQETGRLRVFCLLKCIFILLVFPCLVFLFSFSFTSGMYVILGVVWVSLFSIVTLQLIAKCIFESSSFSLALVFMRFYLQLR